MVSVSIVNVTSYTGMELLRLLAQHPHFQLVSATARSSVGKRLDEVFPHLSDRLNSKSEVDTTIDLSLMLTEEPEQSELAFLCLPHAASATIAERLLERGTKVIDLSADFRLHDAALYEQWYAGRHPAPALLERAVYGLCERYRQEIKHTSLVANPGCYATAAILGLLPAVAAGIITPNVIIDAKSGVSGAGRSLTLDTHYAQANEDVSAYSLKGHRHLPEITQELEAAASTNALTVSNPLRITFIPHLVPMTRGILATCYAELHSTVSGDMLTGAAVRSLYAEYYAEEPFVHIVEHPPHTHWTLGTNTCYIYPTVDTRTGRLVVISCLDNLVKGAAGQAIQNANCLYQLPETTGLSHLPLYP